MHITLSDSDPLAASLVRMCVAVFVVVGVFVVVSVCIMVCVHSGLFA